VLAVRLQVISETHDNATTAPSASIATIIPDNVRIIWVAKRTSIEGRWQTSSQQKCLARRRWSADAASEFFGAGE
jgi:hypothetical protein